MANKERKKKLPPGGITAANVVAGDGARVDMTGYPGSKAASGLCERIIRQMPPHETYVEAFAGHCAVFRVKRPAASSILIDADTKTCDTLKAFTANLVDAAVLCADALQLLPSLPVFQDPATLLYVDPPYLRSVRTRMLYACEFARHDQHAALLEILLELPCMVMISGYASTLYAAKLASWRLVKIAAMTRGGKRIEHLWCNFPEPTLLHDPRFAGQNYRQRERIKRRKQRWASRFLAMPAGERQAVAAALVGVDRTTVEMAMRTVPPVAALADPHQ